MAAVAMWARDPDFWRLRPPELAVGTRVLDVRSATMTPDYCPIHQHFKWCEHNGGVLGETGYEAPVNVEIVTARSILNNPAIWKDGIVPERYR